MQFLVPNLVIGVILFGAAVAAFIFCCRTSRYRHMLQDREAELKRKNNRI